MAGRIVQVDRFGTFTYQADQSFGQAQCDLPDRFTVQAARCHEHIFLALAIQQVDSAHLGTHRLLDTIYDNVQRRGQIPRRVDLLDDSPQNIEHIVQPGSFMN
jgi:hypothetical protein